MITIYKHSTVLKNRLNITKVNKTNPEELKATSFNQQLLLRPHKINYLFIIHLLNRKLGREAAFYFIYLILANIKVFIREVFKNWDGRG